MGYSEYQNSYIVERGFSFWGKYFMLFSLNFYITYACLSIILSIEYTSVGFLWWCTNAKMRFACLVQKLKWILIMACSSDKMKTNLRSSGKVAPPFGRFLNYSLMDLLYMSIHRRACCSATSVCYIIGTLLFWIIVGIQL